MVLVEIQEEGVGRVGPQRWPFSGVLVYCFGRVLADCSVAFWLVLDDCFGVFLATLVENLAFWEGKSEEAALDPLVVFFYHYLLPGVVGEVFVHEPCQDR